MAGEPKNLGVIRRDPVEEDHVLFIGAEDKPVTQGDMFRRFGCDIPNESPPTPDRAEPDVEIEREFFEEDLLVAPDGRKVRIFGFKAPGQPARFPAPTMRFVEGQIVHSRLKVKKNTHTIHHHGIEPTNFNDGVGHTSFEVKSEYTYQFRPRHAGTYFYHCHKNTTLHFEMGMYGFLIVDPPRPVGAAGPDAPYSDGGPGFFRRADEIVPYDVEALWVLDEIDSRFHAVVNHQAGIDCPFYNIDEKGRPTGAENPRLHDFNPDIFVITGVPITDPDPRATARQPIREVAVQARLGQTILVRLLNAGYTVQEITLEGLAAEVIEVDGRTLGRSPFSVYSRPFAVPAGEPIRLTTAQRWALSIRPTAAGTFPVRVKHRQWITGEPLGFTETFIGSS